MKNIDFHIEDNIPELDEGWWAAILAEENDSTNSIDVIGLNSNPVKQVTVDWDKVRVLHDQDEIIDLNVVGFNRGGLLVQGKFIQGFVPVSHLVEMPCGINDQERELKMGEYIGRTLRLKVIEFEQSHDRIVLSERAALAREGQRKHLLQCLKPGEIVSGTVTNVTEFGVFVDLGGLEGLIHVSELSWGRVQDPKYFAEVGQTVDTMVLQVNEDTARVALSLKRLQTNPWESLSRSYQTGDVVPATITSIMRFGAFARLQNGIEGLIHNSSLDFVPGQKSLEDILKIGQDVRVRILHLDGERRRLGLGLVLE
jgi:small subunit ribosomal protein S1